MKLSPPTHAPSARPAAAFTLVEVMIAVAIFFMCMFTILGVLGESIHAATLLRDSAPTAAMIAGQLSLTNKLEEGSLSGDFDSIPFYADQGYRWVAQVNEATTNGLYQVDFAVIGKGGRVESTLNILLYKPGSPGGRMGLR